MIYVTNEDKRGSSATSPACSAMPDQHRDLPSRPYQAGRRCHRAGRGRRRGAADLLAKVQALPQVKQAKALVF